MFLSSIPVETGNDPNRMWPGKRWVSNPYRVHQRLCMGFEGKDEPRILFRIDGHIRTPRGLRPHILVQSITEPDWDAAFRNAPFLIVREALRGRPYDPSYEPGQVLHFRLRANPTRKVKQAQKRNSVRLGIMSPEGKLEWLARKADKAGFEVLCVDVVPEGLQHSRRSKQIDPNRHVHLAATFGGRLKVLDGPSFQTALRVGIGPAKAYGFGLLSVAPV